MVKIKMKKKQNNLIENSEVNKNLSLAFSLSPKEIVNELDRYIIGQNDAKKMVAIALRNRYRRKLVASPLAEEILPKNILMVGPTGVGKTEIARRLAKLANAPFIKVEATKFTEVGYVGRDIESIIRDLIEISVKNLKQENKKNIAVKASEKAKKIILKKIIGEESSLETKEKFSKMLDNKELDNKEIEIDVAEMPNNATTFDIPGAQIGMINISDMIGKAFGSEKTKKVKTTIAEAMQILTEQEAEKMIDEDKIIKDAVKLVENDGIVFIDEIDKICNRTSNAKGGDVSREGVQRDLLPLVEGTTVSTKYGIIKTDHILFIASGAFHIAKPADLLPELQGRFPIRVQLKPLSENDLTRILQEPESSLVRQYQALLAVDGAILNFTDSGIAQIAKIAFQVNNEVENIGARRLHTLLEKILEEVSFEASNLDNSIKVNIDKKYVNQHLGDLINVNNDLSKFIL